MRIAVTGASGRVGGQVAELLAAEPGHEVVALVRPSSRYVPPAGVTVAAADYGDPASLHAALKGADTLVFVSSDGHAATVMLHHVNVVRAAAETGVGHVVALSGLDVDVESPFCYAVTNGHTEELLAASGCGLSLARASVYTEFFAGLVRGARRGDEVRLPAGDARVSLVARADVGRSLAALALRPPSNRHHDLTGPAALDLAEIVAALEPGARYVDVPPAEYVAALLDGGETSWWAHAYATMLESIRLGRWATVSDEVAALTGG
ncbi:NAD(P)H-binding protein [Jiangella alkaliphila]|uniref:NAD(P)H dehydrogenase (Quinone) n=1 Tax=Jiangella alkaliphila TaxID=419479 RepID=A0A1H2KXC5_9ACTN|nr:NAD(P)H-binding protein [Jiangella alkaliphila]SDU73215.1 NAD(P)H dehydrogenase (quinone) [Jiangella alkaliphila]